MLEIKNLSKVYDDGTKALNDVSFNVLDGEFLVIIGLSGSGKSTMLRCINRLVEPTSGQVILDGVDITAASQKDLRLIRRDIGMIFQHFNLVKRSSVMKNVMAGRLGYVNPWLSMLGIFPKEEKERARDALELVGISEKAKTRADSLSGGQQQRVAIARSLIMSPKLLLADEPTGNLDSATSDEILALLDRLHDERDLTIVVVTHSEKVAGHMDRVVHMEDGFLKT